MGSISFPADKWNSVLQGTIPVVFFAYIFSQEILCYLVKFHFKGFDAIRQTPKYGTYSSVWNLNLHAEFTFSLKHFYLKSVFSVKSAAEPSTCITKFSSSSDCRVW